MYRNWQLPRACKPSDTQQFSLSCSKNPQPRPPPSPTTCISYVGAGLAHRWGSEQRLPKQVCWLTCQTSESQETSPQKVSRKTRTSTAWILPDLDSHTRLQQPQNVEQEVLIMTILMSPDTAPLSDQHALVAVKGAMPLAY